MRILALDEAGRVLLVRHSYGSRYWMPPSGGLAAGEEACAAAARELREETGAGLADAVELGTLGESLSGASDTVHLVAGRLTGTPRADNREILAVGLFAPAALPRPMTARMTANLPEWVKAAAGHFPPRPSGERTA